MAACVAVVIAAGALAACSPLRPRTSGCPAEEGPERAMGTPAGSGLRQKPVDEALWVADGSGVLRAFDGRTGRVSARVRVGGPSRLGDAVLAGAGLVWTYRYETGAIAMADPGTARVVRRILVPPARPLAKNTLYAGHGALWIGQPGLLWRINPAGARTGIALPLGFAPGALTATSRWIWATDGRRLMRIDPAGRAVSFHQAPPVTSGIQDLLGTSHGLYATGVNQPTVWTLDPDTATERYSAYLHGGQLALGMIDTGTETWAVGNCADLVNVTDTGRLQARSVKISDVSQDLPTAAALGSLWVCDEVASELVRVDPRTGSTLARIPFHAADPDDPAFAVIAGRRTVWLIDTNLAGGISQVDPAANRISRLVASHGVSPGVSAVVAARPR
jgi:streptogramin lyase